MSVLAWLRAQLARVIEAIRGVLGLRVEAPTLPAPSIDAPPPPPPRGVEEGWLERTLRETALLDRFPQYAGVLARVDPVETTSVNVMAIGLRERDDPRSRLLLFVNPEHFASRPDQRLGVLLHEIQHVVLGHLTDELLHRVAYPRLVEIAMEISADEPIRELVPDHGFFVERFAKYGIAAGQSTMERYVLLRDAYERGELDIEEHWFGSMRDQHRSEDARIATLAELIDARSDGATDGVWSRGSRFLGGPTSRAHLRKMKETIAAHLGGSRGGDVRSETKVARRGKELARVIDPRTSGDRLAWPQILRRAFARVRHVVPDARRPNRRFPARIGEVPGRVRRVPPPRLLVAIDTSGSMTVDVLGRIVDEIESLRRWARVDVVEADAVVHRRYRLRTRPLRVIGGGDTDFGPAIDEADRRREIDGLVYFTDGRGTMPASSTTPVLWVVTHDEPFEPSLGVVVRLPSLRRGARRAGD